ncbi:choice-of-anchor J domain-containing protein [Alloprevotella tannerae]|uniref:choice-of-anchor J domain-containing protein n=1 Tax=Alloprevotella tannerae TaxID=76122 RepID=UPI001ED9D520|nr:choice-of-anchor J domain-containing protein [Alloprevotella tannerae]MCG2651228.1 choice-of-anchor J domain-containing protein [Alloprevotella tannerae]
MRKKTLALMVGLMATLTIEGGLHAQSRFKTGGDKLPKMMKESEKLSIPPNDIRKDYPLLLTAKPTGRNPFKTPGSILGTPKYRSPKDEAASFTMWGNLVSAASWSQYTSSSQYPYGVYSFSVPSMTKEVLKQSSNINANGGGAFYNDRFHFVHFTQLYGAIFASYYEYDVNTWKVVKYDDLRDNAMIAVSATYDQTSGKVYGCFYTSDLKGLTIGTVDYDKAEREVLCPTDLTFLVMAADKYGRLFGIDRNADLYRIDKKTGAQTKIGNTGVTIGAYYQSAAFDFKTNKLYWASASDSEENNVLYEVNVNTGQATEIKEFPDNEQLVCLYIPQTVDKKAPQVVSDIELNFTDASTTGAVKFKLPTKAVDNSALSENLEYFILVDGDTLKTGTAAPGAIVNENVTVVGGKTPFVIFVKNNAGESKRIVEKKWIGRDIPLQPEGIKLTLDTKSKVTLTWTAPTKGKNGGYVNPSDLRYKIVRYPDEVVVADSHVGTTFSEEITSRKLTAYYYKVSAVNEGYTGEEIVSNKVLVGDPLEAPYVEEFDGQPAFDLFTVFDANKDGRTWVMNKVDNMVYNQFNTVRDADDWLISPPIHLNNDRQYFFSFVVQSTNKLNTERISASLGNGTVINESYKVIVPDTSFHGPDAVTLSTLVSVEKDSIYNFAFHATSPSNQGYLFLHKIIVTEGPRYSAPDSITDYTLTAGAEGDLSAELKFRTPTKDLKGKDVGTLTKVEILRNGKLIHTIENPAKGAMLTYKDKSDDIANGFNKYTVVVSNASGAGRVVERDVYIGYDLPRAPQNIKLVDNFDGTALLSWDSPGIKGVNDGYVDESELTYNVFSVQGESVSTFRTGVTERSLDITDVPQTGEQSLFYFLLKASSSVGESKIGRSPWIIAGSPYTLPFHEGFPGGNIENGFWTRDKAGKNNIEIVNETSSDNDGGCLKFLADKCGESASISSGKIDLAQANNPNLLFSYYAVPGKDNVIQVEISKDGNAPQVVSTINYKDLEGDEGWRIKKVDLNNFKGARFIILTLRGIDNNQKPTAILIDDINVRNNFDYNLDARLTAPKQVTAGQSAQCLVTVRNIGDKAADDYTIDLYANNKIVATLRGETLAPEASKTFTMLYKSKVTDPEVSKLKAVVVFDKDMDKTDNTSQTLDINLKASDLPAINDLTSHVDEAGDIVTLTWTAPDTKVSETTEDFEGFKAFEINDLSPWTVEGDRERKTSVWEDFTFPHAGEPFPFIVFNPSEITEYDLSRWCTPHSGKQFLASITNYSAKGNNAWLISPSLSGKKQTIRFWAKSFDGYESIEVRCSKTTADTASLNNVLMTENKIRNKWKEYQVELPEGTKYFAIRVTSRFQQMLMLDDITYESGVGTIIGFNIYRDGQNIATVDAQTTIFKDNTADKGNHNYTVTVIYDEGESRMSNSVSVVTSLKDNAKAETIVRTIPGHIVISNSIGQEVAVFAANGKQVFSGSGQQNLLIPMMRNTYVVKVGNKVYNVLVP